MLMLGLAILSYQDALKLIELGWGSLSIYWKGLLLFGGLLLYIGLIPKMIREVMCLHLSAKEYRALAQRYFSETGKKFVFDPDTYIITTPDSDEIVASYHFSLKYAVWYFRTSFIDRKIAKKIIKGYLSEQGIYSNFSWQGVYFLVITLLLLIRLVYMIQLKAG